MTAGKTVMARRTQRGIMSSIDCVVRTVRATLLSSRRLRRRSMPLSLARRRPALGNAGFR